MNIPALHSKQNVGMLKIVKWAGIYEIEQGGKNKEKNVVIPQK